MLQNKANNIFGNLKATDIFHVVENVIIKMQNLQHLDITQELELNFTEEKNTSDEEMKDNVESKKF